MDFSHICSYIFSLQILWLFSRQKGTFKQKKIGMLLEEINYYITLTKKSNEKPVDTQITQKLITEDRLCRCVATSFTRHWSGFFTLQKKN